MKCFVTPVNIRASGLATKRLKNPGRIPGKHSMDSQPKKKAALRTSHITRKVLQSET